MEITRETSSAEESFELARIIGGALPIRSVVLLEGPMGAGKTVFAKGLHMGTGGTNPHLVTSPSYNLVNRYDDGPRPCYHVDLYRLEDERHLLGLEFEEFLYENPGLTIIEWPRSAGQLMDKEDYLEIFIDLGTDEEARRISLKATGPRYEAVFEALVP